MGAFGVQAQIICSLGAAVARGVTWDRVAALQMQKQEGYASCKSHRQMKARCV